MNETSAFLVNHGAPLIFLAVFLEQMGLPLPAIPILLAAGALSTTGKFSPFLALFVTVLACVIADLFWFYLGRTRGLKVLGWLCRISLEPDTCVRKTQNLFTRYGLRGVLAAKFVPGLSTVVPPLAGLSGVRLDHFLIADIVGSVLYGGCFIFLGYQFAGQLQSMAAAFSRFGGSVLGLVVAIGGSYIAFKYWQRQQTLRSLNVARITVAELRQLQQGHEPILVIDSRSRSELRGDTPRIPGAVQLGLNEIDKRHLEIPRDRDVIIYCSCPNEISSARMALLLRRKGIERTRPLLGGIEAWQESEESLQAESRPIVV